jgi:hypothetical protein
VEPVADDLQMNNNNIDSRSANFRRTVAFYGIIQGRVSITLS